MPEHDSQAPKPHLKPYVRPDDLAHLAGGRDDASHQLDELRRERDAARDALREKAGFLSTMSGGLRAPLHGVLGMIEMLLTSPLTPDQQDCAEAARTSARNLMAVLEEILDYAQLEEGRLSLADEPFELGRVFEELVSRHGADAEARVLELVVQYDTRIERRPVGDGARLLRVLSQLVAHAIRSTERGVVLVRCDARELPRERMSLCFEVAHGGLGLPGGTRPASPIASPTDPADTSWRQERTHLGFALTRELVKRMHGVLESRTVPGRGAVMSFTVELPTVPAAADTPAMPAWNALRALIVEPQAVCRRVLGEHLARRGMRVEYAEGLTDTVGHVESARASHDPYAVVLVAQAQPTGDGLGIGRELRTRFPGPDLSLVLVGGNTTLTTPSAWRTSVFDLVVGKPWTPRALFESLAAMLELAAARRAVRAAHVGTAARARRVLLVDDHPINQKVGKRMLENLGCDVEIAPSGRLGVEMCTRQAFDLVFMDCQLPGLDGFQATRVIRTLEKVNGGRRTPIVALTSNAELEDQEACLRCGMDGFLAMPVDEAGLARVLERFAPASRAAADEAAA